MLQPRRRQLASGGNDRTVRLWDVETGEDDTILRGFYEWDWDWARSVRFSPDGKQLASGWHDSTVRLWLVVPYEDYESSGYDASSSDDNREAGSDGNGGVVV